MADNMAGFGARRFAEKSIRKQEEMRRYEEEQRRYEQERRIWEQEQERLRWEQEQWEQQQQQQQQNDWNNQNGNSQGYDDWNGNGNGNYNQSGYDEYGGQSGGGGMAQTPSGGDWNHSNGNDGYGDQGYDNHRSNNHYQDEERGNGYPEDDSELHSHSQQHSYDEHHYNSSPQNHDHSSNYQNDHYRQDQNQLDDNHHRQSEEQSWDGGNNGYSETLRDDASSDQDPYASNDWEDQPRRNGSQHQDESNHLHSQSQTRQVPARTPTLDSAGSSARLAYGTSSSDESEGMGVTREQDLLDEDEEVFRPPARISVGNSTLRGEGIRRFTNSTLTARSNTTPRASNYGARETFYDDGDEYEEAAWTGGNSSRYTRYEGNDEDKNDSSDYDSEDLSHRNRSRSSSSNEIHLKRKSKEKLSSLVVPNGSSRISSQPRLRERSPLSNSARGAATTSMYAPAPQAKCADCGLEIPFEELADHQCTSAPMRSPTNLTPLESPVDMRSLSPRSGGSASPSPSFFEKYQSNINDGRSNSPAFAPPSRSNSEDQMGSKSPTPSIDLSPEEKRRQIEQQRAAKKKGGAAVAATAVIASLRLAKTGGLGASSSSSRTAVSPQLSSSPTSYENSHKKQSSYSSADSNGSSLLGNEKHKFEMTPSTSYDGSLSPPSPRDTNSPAFKDRESHRHKDKLTVDSDRFKSSSRSRSRSNSDSKNDKAEITDRSRSSTRDISKRFDSRADPAGSDSDLTPAQSPNIAATTSATSRSSRNKSSSPNPSKPKSSSRSRPGKEDVDIGEIENLMNSLTSSPQKIKDREREASNKSKSSRSRNFSESESPRKKEREREISKESSRSKQSVRSPTKLARPELTIRPSLGTGSALSLKEKEKQRAERKNRKCAICQCSLASSKTLCVEQDGKLLCAKDWAELYREYY